MLLVLSTAKDKPAYELGDESANPLPEPERAAPNTNGKLPKPDPAEDIVTQEDTVPHYF